MTFNHPTVLGTALYIGNSYGWLQAYTLADVGGSWPRAAAITGDAGPRSKESTLI